MSRDGRNHLQDARGHRAHTVEIYSRARRPDSRPDLSNRYEDYGWPTTIAFGSDGKEIVKRQGYIEPRQMTAMAKAIIADPTPGPSIIRPSLKQLGERASSPTIFARILEDATSASTIPNTAVGDSTRNSWIEFTEYAMAGAYRRQEIGRGMARQSLNEQFNLIDPASGAASISIQSEAIGRSRTSKRSCPCRPAICESTRWLMKNGTIRLI